MEARVRRRNSVLESIEQLRSDEPRMNATEKVVYFYVAENPGINIATASRSIRALADEAAEGALPPHCGLIDIQPNPDDARGRILNLSEAGRMLCRRIDRVIRNAVPVDV